MKENIKSFNLFNSKIIIFILVFVFVLIGIIIHNLFKNEEKIPYNFQPYPKFSPKNIPSINLGNDNSCYSILTKCINGNCPNCTDDFECVTVENEGQFIYNNTSIPVGDYCLPKVNKNECNSYTGQWVWVNEPEYCGDKGDQCWKCICKYPDLYDNSNGKTDCTNKKACNSPDIPGSIKVKNNFTINKLVSTQALTDYDKNIPVGTEWNPLIDTDDPKMLEALKINPYNKSEDGKPFFQCDCSKEDSVNHYPYVFLPNDPYVCNVNICDSINPISKAKATYDPVNNTINCDCSNAGLDVIGVDDNLYKNKCISPGAICKEINDTSVADFQNGTNIITGCNCSNSFSQKCISIYANIHKSRCNDAWSTDRDQNITGLPQCDAANDNLPPCANIENKIGVECRSACELNVNKLQCVNGGHLTQSTTDNGRTCVANCNCPDGFTGPTCTETCLKSGSDITAYGVPDRDGYRPSILGDYKKCCSTYYVQGNCGPLGCTYSCK
jgi:hypothetical protein